MTPFLRQVATLFYKEYGKDVSRLAFVFPNQRAGLFFRKYLAELTDAPLFSPAIMTITDLFLALSGKQVADRISMLFILYTEYSRISGSTETFDEFLYWGEMLLNDFDDVDKYMANARMLFSNVTDLREIENDFSFLSEKQVAAIRAFWSSFYPKGDSPNQREFLTVWQLLYELYVRLRERLSEEGKGYEGMIFREVVEEWDDTCCDRLGYEGIVFVGLNALSVVEERLLKQLQRMEIADFYWDYVSGKVTDSDNRASYFVKSNLVHFPSKYPLPEEIIVDAEIEVIGIPSGIGQAKQVHSLLSAWNQEGKLEGEEALRTAVVLPDEHLLVPVLNSIPEEIRSINVTMGYPLSGTPAATLIDAVLSLQRNIRYVDGKPLFYFRDVLPILNHRYIVSTSPGEIRTLIADITHNNRIYIGNAELGKNDLLDMLFVPVTDSNALSDYLTRLLEEINKRLNRNEEEGVMTGEENSDMFDSPVAVRQLDSEFLFHFYTTVNRLKDVMREAGIGMRTETYARLLKRAIDGVTIPFRGEPLSGLQVMGVLETRALDFDRVILLSMNDGIFPQRKVANSFIPYNLRRGFALPTYEHQDSVWAYHFYRLIHRARQVSLIYDTRTTGLQTGEVSRFVHQLRYHYGVPLSNKLAIFNVSSSKSPPLEIPKNETVLRRLDDFRPGGAKAISASVINTYLDCPLQFYFSVLEGVQEEEEVTEAIESSMFGSILHKTLEDLYQPLQGKMVTADLLKLIRKDGKMIRNAIACAFAEVFFHSETVRPLTGQNYLIGEMIRKYVVKVLERDGKLTPFYYICSEKRMSDLLTLADGSSVQLKGFIDRIDDVRDTVRIIDYKSGSGLSAFPGVESLFNKEEKDRPKAVMQVFMYAWMYGRTPEGEGKRISPGIYYMRTLFSNAFDPAVYRKEGRAKSELVDDFREYAEDFEEGLRDCLSEIFDPAVPFRQTSIVKSCAWCQFKSICGR